MLDAAPAGRGFLFLQGMATRFFERLGWALGERGHAVHRVNFNGGDRAFWRVPGGGGFCGPGHEGAGVFGWVVLGKTISENILFCGLRPPYSAPVRIARRRAFGETLGRGGLFWA